jgi:hypothetical protein
MRSLFERMYKALATVALWMVARILLALSICGVGAAGFVLTLGAPLFALGAAVFCIVILSALSLFAGLLVVGLALVVVSAIVFCGAILYLE